MLLGPPGPQVTELVRVRPNAHDPSWPPVLIFCVAVVVLGALCAALVFLRRAWEAARPRGGRSMGDAAWEHWIQTAQVVAGDAVRAGWQRIERLGTIGPRSRRARLFRRFGDGSAICFPVAALYGEEHIELGEGCIIGPYCSLSAGVMPGQVLDHSPVVTIGDRVLIGKGSGIVGHHTVEIGDDVFTGHHVYITDANHGYEDRSLPIGKQFAPTRAVRIGSGSWLGHGTVVLPGADIGRNVAVGAGSVVTGALPDFSVAVGNPARVIRRFVDGEGWVKVEHHDDQHGDQHTQQAANQDANHASSDAPVTPAG